MRLPLIDCQDHNLTSLIILSFKSAKLNIRNNRRKKIHHLLFSLFISPASQLVYLYAFQKTGTTLPNFSIKTCKLVIYIRLCGWHFSDTCENLFNWFQYNSIIKHSDWPSIFGKWPNLLKVILLILLSQLKCPKATFKSKAFEWTRHQQFALIIMICSSTKDFLQNWMLLKKIRFLNN